MVITEETGKMALTASGDQVGLIIGKGAILTSVPTLHALKVKDTKNCYEM